jgi:nucleoside-diphosphate-sugar epimerase
LTKNQARSAAAQSIKTNLMPWTSSADVEKPGRLLDWTAAVSPSDGFRLTADWHRRNAVWLDSVNL